MLGVLVVQAGLTVVVVGSAALAKPLAFLGIRSRRQGALVVAAGMVLVLLGLLLPVSETQVGDVSTLHDEVAPRYQFSEFHRIEIAASRDQVYRAVKEVTADEIPFFRTLTWIRRFGRPGPESILNAPEHEPLLEVVARTTFLVLAEEPGQEIVVGTLVLAGTGSRTMPEPTPGWFRALDAPSFAKATMNFRIEVSESQGCVLTTETRVYATDAAARRKFAPYWRVIYPGSALIRRMWLRAIKTRAEASPEVAAHAYVDENKSLVLAETGGTSPL